jgi:hypothetical protein
MVQATHCDEGVVLLACKQTTKGRISHFVKGTTANFTASFPSVFKAKELFEGPVVFFFVRE